MKLIQEASIDDKFSKHLSSIQTAIAGLQSTLDEMMKAGSMHKPTKTQQMSLRYAAEDLKKLYEKAQ